MIQWATTKLTELQALIQLGIGVLVVFAIGKTFHATKALVPTAGIALLGGGVMWAITHTSWFEEKVELETGAPAPTELGDTVTVTVDPLTGAVVVTL